MAQAPRDVVPMRAGASTPDEAPQTGRSRSRIVAWSAAAIALLALGLPLLVPVHVGPHARLLSGLVTGLLRAMEWFEPDPNGPGWSVVRPALVLAALVVGAVAATGRPRATARRVASGLILAFVGLAATPVLLLDRGLALALVASCIVGSWIAAAAGAPRTEGDGDGDGDGDGEHGLPGKRAGPRSVVLWMTLALGGALGTLALAELAWVTPGTLPSVVALRAYLPTWTAAAPHAPAWFAAAAGLAGLAVSARSAGRLRGPLRGPLGSNPRARAVAGALVGALGGLVAGALVLALSAERSLLASPSVLVALLVASLVASLVARGVTAGHPAALVSVRGGAAALLAVLLLHLPIVAWSQLWPCDAVARSPYVRVLSAAPDTFDMAITADGRWLVTSRRDAGDLTALNLAGGAEAGLDRGAALRVLSDAVAAPVFGLVPENVETLAGGETLAWVYVVLGEGEGPPAPDRPVLVRLAVSSGVLEVREAWNLGGCWPANLDVDDASGSLLVACEEEARLQIIDPSALGDADALRTVSTSELGPLERLEDDGRGQAQVVTLWGAPSLATVRLADGETVSRTPIGGFNWDLVVHPGTGHVFVPRFLEGHVIEVAPDAQRVVRTLPGGFGMRAVELDAKHERLFAASGYDGRMWGYDLTERTPPRRLVVGSVVRSLLWDDAQERLFVGGECGVLEIDHAAWFAGVPRSK